MKINLSESLMREKNLFCCCTVLPHIFFSKFFLWLLNGLTLKKVTYFSSTFVTITKKQSASYFFFFSEYKDPEKALSLFHRACEQKSSGACNNAGLVYQNGIKDSSIQKDMYKAIDMFQKSCDHGHPNGCFNLSVIYLTGKDGIPKDLTRAFQLSLKSCGLMHPWACANLSHMYSIGDGVDKNQQEAEKYKRLAKKYSGRELRI